MLKDKISMGWELLVHNYKGDVDLGTTEYAMREFEGDRYLLIPGSNEILDWKENFNLVSANGIKKVGVDAMWDIIDHLVSGGIELRGIDYIFCHSKSAPTGVSFAVRAKKFNYKCKVIAFNPARSVRRSAKIELDNMIMFRNRFDAVSELLGRVNFAHPKLTKYPTYFGWSYKHYLKHWREFLNNLKEEV